jgi:hypothetical protein
MSIVLECKCFRGFKYDSVIKKYSDLNRSKLSPNITLMCYGVAKLVSHNENRRKGHRPLADTRALRQTIASQLLRCTRIAYVLTGLLFVTLVLE